MHEARTEVALLSHGIALVHTATLVMQQSYECGDLLKAWEVVAH